VTAPRQVFCREIITPLLLCHPAYRDFGHPARYGVLCAARARKPICIAPGQSRGFWRSEPTAMYVIKIKRLRRNPASLRKANHARHFVETNSRAFCKRNQSLEDGLPSVRCARPPSSQMQSAPRAEPRPAVVVGDVSSTRRQRGGEEKGGQAAPSLRL